MKILKQYRLALILVGVMGILAGVTFWDDWKTKKDEQVKSVENKLVTISEEQISEVHYLSTGATDSFDKGADKSGGGSFEAHLKKVNGQWRLTSPIDLAADETSIKSLLTSLKDYKYDKAVSEDKSKWKDFGLDPAARKLTLTFTRDGKVEILDIYIGAKAPVGYSAYVATSESSKVLIGSQHIVTATAKTLSDLRDKTVAMINEKDVSGLHIEIKGKPAVEIAKREGKYIITSPEPLAADEMAVKDLIEELGRTKASEFIDHPPADISAKFSPSTAIAKITWTSTTGPAASLYFAEKEKALWAAYDAKSLLMKLPDDARPKILKSLNELRDRKIFSLATKDVEAVEVDGLGYKKSGGEWYTAEDAAKSPVQGKPKGFIQSLLVDLEFAKGEDFLAHTDKSLKELGAPQQKIKIEFSSTSKQPALLIESWEDPANKEKILIRYTNARYVYRAAKSVLANASETSIKSASEPLSPLNFGKADDPTGGAKEDKSANH